MRFKQIFYVLLLAILLIGCSDSETGTEDEKNEEVIEQKDEKEEQTEEEQVEEVDDDLDVERFKTEDIEELMQLEPGIYGGENYNENIVKEEILTFNNNVTGEDYYYRLLALVADDYRELYEQISNFDTSYDGPTEAPDGSVPDASNAPIGKEVNVAILLDASGSMAGEVDGKTKMEHAVNAIESFVSILPSDVNVSLQVYGNEGTSSANDKELSCKSTEVVYNLAPYDVTEFSAVLNEITPAGWTPLAASISATFEDLQRHSADGAENIVYIVSDGMETCGGNPVGEAEKLNDSDMQAVINIIGFDVDDEGQNELKLIAEAGDGKYMTVKSQKEIEEFFNEERRELEKAWLAWQSENVSNYYGTEREKLNHLSDLKREIYDKALLERDNLLLLAEFLTEELNLDQSINLEINQKIRDRYGDIQTYTRNKEQELMKEIREKAVEHREEVREKGEEESGQE